ncbi:hypothetical protein BD413DRAFT_488247 [Trametes elegans]|nr:hypothetical protein BD413DRAFT_488247 [Trametes elegans]
MSPPSLQRWTHDPAHAGIVLASAEAVESFAPFMDNLRRCPSKAHSTQHDSDEDSGRETDSAYESVPSSPSAGPSRPSSPPDGPLLRSLALAIPPSELSPAFPTHALLRILSAAASSLTHLSLSHLEPLLALDPAIPTALAACTRLTHLSLSHVGPTASELLTALSCRLQDVQVDFDDHWVASVMSCPSPPPTLIPSLPNGHLPTPAPSPATTPAANAPSVLPDPIPLLVHSMSSLRVLRASNAVIVTVADRLRYPAVRELRLRIAGVPTVTPLVHAFPAVADLYVYTPYDGCAHTPPPLPPIDATRDANRTSQMYSSFSPLSRVRGFAPGLYALGLTCPVRELSVGAVAPAMDTGGGTTNRRGRRQHAIDEVEQLRRILADTRPARLALGLVRGWWAPGSGEHTRAGLKRLFVQDKDGRRGWSGLKELVLNVDEVGRWPDVTGDLSDILQPLATSLTILVLRWDRTSVPFDRMPADDDREDGAEPISPLAAPPVGAHDSRTESFVRRLAQAIPALRYICVELLLDAAHPALAPPTPSSSVRTSPSPPPSSIWSPEAQHDVSQAVVAAAGTGKLSPPAILVPDVRFTAPARRVERRFWRVARQGKERWLCLDPIDEEQGLRVLEGEELCLEDGVRY